MTGAARPARASALPFTLALAVLVVAAAAALASCDAHPPPACASSLDGVWRTGQVVDGEAIGYHVLDKGGAAEGYPTFRDVPALLPPGVTAAPAALDLTRGDDGTWTGRWSRRYQLAGARCTISAVATARCVGRTLELALAPLAPPADWTACPKPGAPPPPPSSPPTVLVLHR